MEGWGIVVEAGVPCFLCSLSGWAPRYYGEKGWLSWVPTDCQKLLPVSTLGTQYTLPPLRVRLSGQGSSLKPWARRGSHLEWLAQGKPESSKVTLASLLGAALLGYRKHL